MSPEQIQKLRFNWTVRPVFAGRGGLRDADRSAAVRAGYGGGAAALRVNGQRPAASAADPTLPPLVDEVFRMALNKSPDERFATCSAFVNALCTAAGIELVAPAGSGTGIQTRTQPPAPVAPLPPPPPAYTAPPPPPPISPQPAKGAPIALYIGVDCWSWLWRRHGRCIGTFIRNR